MRHSIIVSLALLWLSHFSFAQSWVELMNAPHPQFHKTQKAFNEHWKSRSAIKGHGWKQFKRWEYNIQSHLDANGELPPAGYYQQVLQDYLASHPTTKSKRNSWTPVGPDDISQLHEGIGRVQCFAIDPSNNQVYWAGTPGGGLWKSTNAGAHWDTGTDQLTSLGISWILIDPNNPQVMYISTGDPDGQHTYSTGVLKSTDGGNSWTSTGLDFSTDQYKRIFQLRFSPDNSSKIFAATNDGIYVSSDGGANWAHEVSGQGIAFDIEFHPTNSSIIYAGMSGKVMKSTDGGNNWSTLSDGLPSSWYRTAIEVSAAAPQEVFVMTAQHQAFEGIYKSTNEGTSFSSLNVNIGLGNQMWWDMVFKVDPSNSQIMYAGGIGLLKTNNGGSNWLSVRSSSPSAANYMHVDHHNMYFINGQIFVCNDGGLYRSSDNAATWNHLGQGMQIMQFYRMSSYAYDENFMLGGSQDNGTATFKNNVWEKVFGGDGMDNSISRQNPNVVWQGTQTGPLYKSTNGGQTFMGVKGNINESGGWVTPYVMSPHDHNVVIAGYANVWKTVIGGNTWTKISDFEGTSVIQDIAIDWNNPDNIYVSRVGVIWKTTDGGQNWINVSQNINGFPGTLRSITIDPDNFNKIWVCTEGLNAGNKVFHSSDGGQNWSNVSGTLPAVPMMCIDFAPGSNDGVYIGSAIGVFYKNASMNDWQLFSNGLPNVNVRDIDIHPASGKIRAATFGRGIWESPLFDDPASLPVPDFKASSEGGCQGTTVQFSDFSAQATSWNWTFEGGTPSQSTDRNPLVSYSQNGEFDVTLTVSNANGSKTLTRSDLINISGQVITLFPYTENFDGETVGSTTFTNGWTNSQNDDEDWFIHSGPAPIRTGGKAQDAGPESDHTSGNGNYLLYEVDAGNKWGHVLSPCFDLSTINSPVLEFYEHIWGVSSQGEMHMDILADGQWHLDVIPVVQHLGNFWLKKTLDLSTYDNQVIRIRFRALSTWSAKDFALDDIRIYSHEDVAPEADFIATVTSGFEGFETQFFDQSTHLPSSYHWSFPGASPSTSTDANPAISYTTPGVYDVTLTVTNEHGSHTVTKSAYVSVSGAVYNMSSQTVSECIGRMFDSGGPNNNYGANEDFVFTIAPEGATQVVVDFLSWGLSDGDILSIYDGEDINAPLLASFGGFFMPPQMQANSGAMTIRFESNDNGFGSGWQLEWNAIGGSCSPGTTTPAPIADFSTSSTQGVPGDVIVFTSESENVPTGWTWILEGGSPERVTGQQARISYPSSGTFDVTLIVVNAGGRDTLIRTNHISISQPPAVINIHTGTETACEGTLYDDGGPDANYTDQKDFTLTIEPPGATSLTMNFEEWSVENNYDFLRIYNGTSTSAPQIGSWSGTNPGSVTASSGAMTLRFTSDYSVNAAGWKATWSSTGGECSEPIAPIANFDVSDRSVDAGSSIQFTDQSQNGPTSWNWSFAGGTPASSTDPNPSVLFSTVGSYVVSLTVSNEAGSDTHFDTITVTEPSVEYNMSNQTVTECSGTLYDTGGGSGNYGNKENLTFIINPTNADEVSINFSSWNVENNYDYLYIYNGTSTSAPLLGSWSGANPGTVTASSGAMTLRFVSDTYVTGTGWQAEWNCSINTDPPVADFNANNTQVSEGQSVQFTDLSDHAPSTWSWTFEGGTPSSSTDAHPSVSYSQAGTYNVTLTVSNNFGSDSKTITDYITVSEANVEYNMGNAVVTDCDGTLFDSGGPQSNYGNLQYHTFSIRPTGASSVSITFEAWNVENNYDFLYIYNGTSTSAPLLGSWSGYNPGTVTASSGAMTLRFISDYSVNGSGWEANWTSVGGDCGSQPPHESNTHTTYWDNPIKIVPNPNNGQFQVLHSEKISLIEVMDLSGKTIMSKADVARQVSVDISDYPQGMYLIRAHSPNGVKIVPFVKQ